LQKFGIGKWKKIMESKCLPGKSIGQIYMQTQRLIGQQSLGDFMGLHVDLQMIFHDNMKKQNAKRKNNCIINEGDNPNKEERKRKIEENRSKYGLTIDIIRSIKLPKVHAGGIKEIYSLEEIESNKFSTLEKIKHLEFLKRLIEKKLIVEKDSEDGLVQVVITVKKVGHGKWQLEDYPDYNYH